MTAKEKATALVSDANDNITKPAMNAAHTMFLAGIGAVVVTKDEIEAAVERLAEKGEVVEKDGRKMFDDLFSRRKEDMSKAEEKFEGMLDQRIESVLTAMNIPSKGDIEGLNKQIASLSRKVISLDKKVSAETKKAA